MVKAGKLVNPEDRKWLCSPFCEDDVKNAMWQIGGDKAPGPDGYTSQFFKDNWATVGGEVCEAVLDFFAQCKMLNQINATTITLILKVKNPTSVNEFRPIACCSTIYKCTSKMICNRLKRILPYVIDEAQCALWKEET